MRRAIYLDSTIPSYLFDERASLQTYVEVTQRWWEEERQHFDLWVSEETIAEVSRGEYPNKTKIIECVSHIAVLAPHPSIIDIAQVYLHHYLMPRTLTGDALHLAYACGRIQLTVARSSWELAPGDVVVFRGDQKHAYRNTSSHTTVAYSVVAFAPVAE